MELNIFRLYQKFDKIKLPTINGCRIICLKQSSSNLFIKFINILLIDSTSKL